MARICLISQEHHPHSGGIGVSVPALAAALRAEHDVTLVTDGRHGDTLPPAPPGVRRISTGVPGDHRLEGFACDAHAYSAAVLRAIEAAYGDGPGPDLLETPDYRAEGFVVLQAARTGHELLARTRVAVRLRGTLELALLHDDDWPDDEEILAVFAMERELLARADQVLYAGGDTHAACARYYGEDALAPASRVPLPLPPLPEPPPRVPRGEDEPLRLLFAGRLERRKGVLELLDAVLRLPSAAVRLTLVGGDTRSGPLGRSMLATLQAMAADDERIEFLDARPRAGLHALMAASDVVVLPSRFEWWANVANEAMHAGVPVLATPVGGFTEQVVHGETGWLAGGTDAASLAAAIARLAADREAVDAMRASGAPRRHVEALTATEGVLSGYRALLELPRRRSVAQRPAVMPRVTAVIPARDAGDLVAEAVDSFLAQAGDRGDVVVVDDGSGPEGVAALDRLRERPRVRVLHRRHGGPSAARNTGIDHADGDYVLLLDADDLLEPGFLERAVAALEADPGLGYATPWMAMEYVDRPRGGGELHAWCPLGAGPDLLRDSNVVGGSCALFPRRIFTELGHRQPEHGTLGGDRETLEHLWRDGRPGIVIPARLLRRRYLATGMTAQNLDQDRGAKLRELRARLRARETRWTATAA